MINIDLHHDTQIHFSDFIILVYQTITLCHEQTHIQNTQINVPIL